MQAFLSGGKSPFLLVSCLDRTEHNWNAFLLPNSGHGTPGKKSNFSKAEKSPRSRSFWSLSHFFFAFWFSFSVFYGLSCVWLSIATFAPPDLENVFNPTRLGSSLDHQNRG
jgi:hypothetical protein